MRNKKRNEKEEETINENDPKECLKSMKGIRGAKMEGMVA